EVGRDAQRLAYARFRFLAPFVGGGQALLGARAGLARLRQRLDRLGRGLVEGGLPVFGFLKPVGGVLARFFSPRDLRQERAPARVDLVGRLGQRLVLGPRLLAALAQGGNLALGVVGAGDPRIALGRDRGQPP